MTLSYPRNLLISALLVWVVGTIHCHAPETSREKRQAGSRKIVCYYTNWAKGEGDGNFQPEDIDPNLCTHVIYSFVGLTRDAQVVSIDPYADLPEGQNGFKRVQGLKSINPNLKVLVAIGGGNADSSVFSQVVNDNNLRAAFVQNAANFVRDNGFDGFDLDWEYPAQNGGAPSDKQAFSSLVREMRQEFNNRGYLLSAAVGVGGWLLDSSYEVPVLSENLDFINMMTYDFHGPWTPGTGQNAPLYASSVDTDKSLNVDAAINAWIAQGASPDKMVLGTAAYGRTFTLAGSSPAGPGAPTVGPGNPGPITNEPGVLGYIEICQQINEGQWTVQWDDEQKNPYAYHDNQWLGYDNVESITIKAQYSIQKGLSGCMVWSLPTDDFRGRCGQGNYPLVSALKNVLG